MQLLQQRLLIGRPVIKLHCPDMPIEEMERNTVGRHTVPAANGGDTNPVTTVGPAALSGIGALPVQLRIDLAQLLLTETRIELVQVQLHPLGTEQLQHHRVGAALTVSGEHQPVHRSNHHRHDHQGLEPGVYLHRHQKKSPSCALPAGSACAAMARNSSAVAMASLSALCAG